MMLVKFARATGKSYYSALCIFIEFINSDKEYIELINCNAHKCVDPKCFYVGYFGNKNRYIKFIRFIFYKHNLDIKIY